MNTLQMKTYLSEGRADAAMIRIYGESALETQKERYLGAIDAFAAQYGAEREIRLLSVSGRSELSGNHTDHNHGCVVAASIDLDIIAVASAREDGIIRVQSEGFPEDVVDFCTYVEPIPEKFGSSASIIAGMCQGFVQNDHRVGGFDAYTTSNVFKGSGLSSSAAFEDMIGNILNHLYNEGQVSNVEIAKLSQYAENVFFGKPCGLMDQMACAVGGIIAIDFADPKNPVIEQIDLDLVAAGYRLCIVNTGGNHADLTEDYAAVPSEMKAVAEAFGARVLRDVEEMAVLEQISTLREKLGDRAILRALHFFRENERVALQKDALLRKDLDGFFAQVLASGRSSFCYLQNVYTTKNLQEQGLSLALCLAEAYLKDKKAAWRVHGGGFAGTIQAYVPNEDVEGFCDWMEAVFGKGNCIALRIRPEGAVCLV